MSNPNRIRQQTSDPAQPSTVPPAGPAGSWNYNRRLQLISHGSACSLCAQWTNHYLASLTDLDPNLEDALASREKDMKGIAQLEVESARKRAAAAQNDAMLTDAKVGPAMDELKVMRMQLREAREERDDYFRENMALRAKVVELQSARSHHLTPAQDRQTTSNSLPKRARVEEYAA